MSLFDVTIDILYANIGLIAVFFVSFWFLFVYLPRKPKCFPPGPKGLPILGVALSLGRRPERIFQKWAKEYGDVIGFKVGTSYTVVLNSYESIQDALVKYGPAFGSRPNNLLFTEGLRKSGISGSDYSHEYMVQRNFAKGALGKLGFGKTFLEEPILDEARYLVESIGEGKVEFNSEVKKKILFANGNVIARVSFGERFDSADNPDFVTILSAWNTFFRTSAPAFQAAMISPYLLYLPILHQSAMSLKMGLDKHMEIIKHRFKTHREKLDLNDPKDFIDELIIEQKKNGTDKLYTEKMLECMVRDTFGGGLETVELTLIFSVLLLANRPHILKKVQDEIDTVIGSTGKARYALREKMPYTHAVIKEVMRFRTVAPMLVPHAVHENVKFKGYEIPKGTTIFPNIYAVHFNEEYWDKPEEFNPERFINDEGKVQTPKYFMPFGLGPRLCIGRSLAEMEVFILFTTILQHYDVVPIPKPGCERPWVFDDAESVGLTEHFQFLKIKMSFLDTAIDILSVNVGIIAFSIVSCWFIFIYLPKKPKCFPPGPRGLPILGVGLSIGNRPDQTFRKWAKQYGDVIGFKVGTSYTVVLNSYERIQDAFVKYGASFGHRPNHLVFTEGLRKSGLAGSDYSHDYMIQRNFAKGVLGKLGFGKTVMEEPILDEAHRLVESIGEGKVDFNDEIKKKIMFSSGNIISQITFGERFDNFDDPDYVTILNGWIAFFHTSALAFQAAMISPSLLHLPIINKSAMSVKIGLDKHMEVIKDRFKKHRENLDVNNPKDFIDELLIEQRKNGNNQLYTDEMIECMVRDVFGGGLETTELTLIFGLLVLANRPHILKKVHDELDTVIGATGKARYALREKLPYTYAVIKEVMRFRNIAPLLIPHTVQENVKFKGYEIPKGTTILANIYAVHFSEQYWDKPDEFIPERFINDEGKVEVPKYYMPFGAGPRLCIGRQLAEMEVFIFFTTILQHYDVIPIPKPGCERPWVFDDAACVGLAVSPPSDTPIYLVSRHGATE